MRITRWLPWLLLLALAIAFLGVEFPRKGDLHIYLQAARDLLEGEQIYHNLYGDAKVFVYMGSPTLAFLLSGFSSLSFVASAIIWKSLSLVLLGRIWFLLKDNLPWNTLDYQKKNWILLGTGLAASFLLYIEFHMVQFTIFILFTSLEGLHQIRVRKSPLLGSVILGLGIISKILPIVMLPYLLYRGKWKAVCFTTIAVVALALLPAIVLGWHETISLYSSWFDVINPTNSSNSLDVTTRTVHGIGALISTLCIPEIGNVETLPIRRHLLSLHPELVQGIVVIVKLFLIVFTIRLLGIRGIFTDPENKLARFWELSYILMITPLIFPAQRSYAFLFILPALVYLIYGFVKLGRTAKPWQLGLFVLSLITINLDLIAGEFREYFWHYKTLTYGVIALLIFLVWMTPSKLSENKAA
jgi:hypothetical protein